jgi:hypothetical protein
VTVTIHPVPTRDLVELRRFTSAIQDAKRSAISGRSSRAKSDGNQRGGDTDHDPSHESIANLRTVLLCPRRTFRSRAHLVCDASFHLDPPRR